jgi:hypothetical protein
MVANINEAVEAIKRVGGTNARIVPMPGQDVNGRQQVEIREGTSWNPVVTGVSRKMAEDIIAQAVNKVILG